DQTEVFFKIKRSTQLKKLMEAYCERQGKSVASVRFLYDGERIQATNTPNELEMEDGDSIDVMWSRHKHLIDTYAKYYPDKFLSKESDASSKTELEILRENHRFLRSEEEDKDLSWEKRIAKKYYDKLFKEYALVELKYYREGKIAMRWRTENEVTRGKGQFTCGSLRCDETKGLQSWEVNFAYVEQGEKKNALVKVRLCERCSDRLNYKKKQKRAESHNHRDSPDIREEIEVDRKSREAKEERYSSRPRASSPEAHTMRHDRTSRLREDYDQDRRSPGTSGESSRRDRSSDSYHSRTRGHRRDRRRSESESPQRKPDRQFESFFVGLFE
ncbi:hypothetical protein BG000_004883, partial [Podila horticola]